MGLFDTIKVEKKLPINALIKQFLGKDFDPRKLEFQTKDLNCAMSHYKITEKGDLYYENIEYRDCTPEEIEQEKREAPQIKGWSFPRIGLKVKSRSWEKTDITCNAEFYEYFKHSDGRYYSIDYSMHVVKGKVKNIKIVKFERETDEDHASRLENEARWAEEIRRHNEKTSRISYKILNNLYNKPIRSLLRLGQRYSQKIPAALYKLERKILY